MKILVVGSSGQVARAFSDLAKTNAALLEIVGRPVLDLTDPGSIERRLQSGSFDLVINAAAYTAVDAAESEEETATEVNGTGAGVLAQLTAARDIPLFHISTDYVFDGTHSEPYEEEAPTAPLGAYGRSKLIGEVEVAKRNPRHLIFRTAWVYSPYGKNFVKTMLRLADDRDEVSVVSDQLGNPTSAHDIASALLDIASSVSNREPRWGVYHLVGSGAATWADFAEQIFSCSKRYGGPYATVQRITTDQFPTPAPRPANSRLCAHKLQSQFGIALPVWNDSVDACVKALLEA